MEKFENVCVQVNACALSGVVAFFAGIPRAVVVTNSPLWCYFNVLKHFSNRQTENERIYCTRLDNTSLVYGTEENLRDTLEMVKRDFADDIAVLCIENSCAVTLIGDDIEAIARQVGFACPIICLDSGGLQGDFYAGYQLAAREYLEQFPLLQVLPKLKHTVNLIGGSIATYNYENDMAELKSLLQLIGYEVIACPGCESTSEAIHKMGQAELNIVVNEGLGLGLAQHLEERYQMPYINLALPYGIEGTANWLRQILRCFKDEAQAKQAIITAWIQQYHDRIETDLKRVRNIWGELQFPQVVLAGEVSVVIGLLKTIQTEWADCASSCVILTDGLIESELVQGDIKVLDGSNDSQQIKAMVRNLEDGLLLGSSNERALILRNGLKHAVCHNISAPNYDEVILLAKPYVGFRGALALLEEIWNKYIVMKQQRNSMK